MMILPALLLVFPSSLRADFNASAKGTTAAEFLTLGVGARAVSLGEAYSAVADEASAVYWNPAALTRIPGRSATFMHAAHIDSSFFDYFAYAQGLGRWGAAGASAHYLSAGSIPETDITGARTGEFTPNDMALSLAYAYKIETLEPLDFLEGYSLGISGKYIRSHILSTASSGAVDFGVLSPAYLGDRLNLAASLSNWGGKIEFERESADLPLMIRTGASVRIARRWLASLDGVFPRNANPYAGIGTEYILPARDNWSLAGRLGFNSRSIGDAGGVVPITLGAGLSYRKLSVDYALLPLGAIGNSHRVSLTFNF